MQIVNILKFILTHPLASRHKMSALQRFLRWQIGSRIVSGEVVHQWINGSRVVVSVGDTGFTGNIYTGLHDFADMAYLLHVLRQNDLFLDIGANIGSYTILASWVVKARTIAFEPVLFTFERLKRNVSINFLEDIVEAHNIAIGDTCGNLHFSRNEDTTNHVISENEHIEDIIQVKVRNLDDFPECSSASLMKIDVEGYEKFVLNGGQQTLKNENLHSVIMELNGSGTRYGVDENDIIAMMRDYGFDIYRYEPFSRELIPLGAKCMESNNTIFVRNLEKVLDNIKKARQIEICGVLL